MDQNWFQPLTLKQSYPNLDPCVPRTHSGSGHAPSTWRVMRLRDSLATFRHLHNLLVGQRSCVVRTLVGKRNAPYGCSVRVMNQCVPSILPFNTILNPTWGSGVLVVGGWVGSDVWCGVLWCGGSWLRDIIMVAEWGQSMRRNIPPLHKNLPRAPKPYPRAGGRRTTGGLKPCCWWPGHLG
jgi:hypothetical protein